MKIKRTLTGMWGTMKNHSKTFENKRKCINPFLHF